MTATPTQRPITNWQRILWQEWRYCGDKAYARQLRRILIGDPLSWIYFIGFRGQARPYTAEVEVALHRACQMRRGVRHLWQKRLVDLAEARQKPAPVATLIDNLQENHWFERFIARHVLFYRGCEAVPSLLVVAQTGSLELSSVAGWLLHCISEDTIRRLEAKNLLCVDCIVHSHRFELGLPGVGTIVYYGCPRCRQSHDFRTWPGGVAAVLDRRPGHEKVEADGQIRVNWLLRRDLFDFDWVEIIRATDEEVERFAVQVGNDPDELRRSRYEDMRCIIGPECTLSENTMRILEHTFGRVVREEL
ncbi:MAG TPA: hypothetical protein VGD99_26520 [Anaerolineae bacterium]